MCSCSILLQFNISELFYDRLSELVQIFYIIQTTHFFLDIPTTRVKESLKCSKQIPFDNDL